MGMNDTYICLFCGSDKFEKSSLRADLIHHIVCDHFEWDMPNGFFVGRTELKAYLDSQIENRIKRERVSRSGKLRLLKWRRQPRSTPV